jgi:hypothetical protein
MEDYDGINKISRQIAEKDAELASLFDSIIGEVMHAQEERNNLENYGSRVAKQSKTIIEDIASRIKRYGNINVIPGSGSTSCHAYCMCFAFDKWQASKGFRGIAKSTIEYWLSCSKINKGTLILSYAWDEIDFIEKYKHAFDQYANEPTHTIAVILISSRGISIQYLNN